MKSVYIHIPFCNSICTYCDFCKVIKCKDWITKYLKSLKDEIEDNYSLEKIKSIYIGGGTPSCLAEEDLTKLFEITNSFNKSDNCEFSFECNLEDIKDSLLDILKENGVNRLSIGIESFDKEKLKYMNRRADFKDAKDKMELCRSRGFNNINLDLIYGLPEESIFVLKNDLDLVLKLKPNHVSIYSLIIEDNTIVGIKNNGLLESDEEASMYEYICKKMKNKKYIHYEVSNFCLNGYESLHNITYWKNEEYYGFGLGAHGYIEGFRYENTKSLTKYLNHEFRKSQNILSKQENMENELMLGLRLLKGINIKEFYQKYNINIQEVFDFNDVVRNKEIIYKDGNIFIPENKIYIMNEILIKLL